MAQFYTLEEAARVLGMSPEELKNKAQHREIRAFMDSGSWRFRVADIDELARRRGMGSDPELSLSDLDLSVPTGGSASDEINLSEFQLGTVKPDLGPQSIQGIPAFEVEKDVQFDEFALPQASGSNSSSTILGMDQGGKLPSDSDVRVMPESLTGPSDSDVRLAPIPSRGPGDSDVTLVNDDQSLGDFSPVSGSSDTAIRQSPLLGSSAEVSAADGGSDFELTPSQNVIDALQPESGSDFELTALDQSDEFESTPLLTGPGDSDVTAAEPTASGINLGRPSDSGINLGGIGLEDLQADSIELSPLSGDEIKAVKAPTPPPAANPAPPKPSLAATPPPSAAKGEKDIFDDTDFSLEVDAFDSGGDSSEHEDKTVQIDRGSDFEIDDSDSASEVFALDEDEVDTSAATAMAPAVTDDESGEFSADDAGDAMGGGWDVESESVPSRGSASASSGSPILTSAAAAAEWSGIWVGVLGFASFLMLLALFISFDLIRNLYEYKGGSLVGSGLIKSIAGLFGG